MQLWQEVTLICGSQLLFILFLFGIIRSSKTPVHKVTKLISQRLAAGFCEGRFRASALESLHQPWGPIKLVHVPPKYNAPFILM